MAEARDEATDQWLIGTTVAPAESTMRNTHDSGIHRQNFVFINNWNDRSRSREAARVHVMREVHQKKRLLKVPRESTGRTTDGDWMRSNLETIQLDLMIDSSFIPPKDPITTAPGDQHRTGRRTPKGNPVYFILNHPSPE